MMMSGTPALGLKLIGSSCSSSFFSLIFFSSGFLLERAEVFPPFA
jgi:hypothetical protein